MGLVYFYTAGCMVDVYAKLSKAELQLATCARDLRSKLKVHRIPKSHLPQHIDYTKSITT